jgi:hypothetical protein
MPANCVADAPNRRVTCTASLNSGGSAAFDIPVIAGFTRAVIATATASSNASETNAANNVAVTVAVQVRLRPMGRQNLPPKLP